MGRGLGRCSDNLCPRLVENRKAYSQSFTLHGLFLGLHLYWKPVEAKALAIPLPS